MKQYFFARLIAWLLIFVFMIMGTTQPVRAAPTCEDLDQYTISSSECQALVNLNVTTGGNSWVNQWDGNEPCIWYGVICGGNVGGESLSEGESPSEVQPYVWELALSKNNLTGELPYLLTNLTKLWGLNVSDNALQGPIPAFLGEITSLEVLRLDHNQYTDTIPPELGALTNLAAMNLSNNYLEGDIPSELSALTNLSDFRLSSNYLTGTLPAWLGNLDQLTILSLDDNRFTGSIPPELGSLAKLGWLLLNSNELTGEIPPELGNATELYSLELQHNYLSGEIPVELSNLTKTMIIDVSSNQLRGEVPLEVINRLGDEFGAINIRYNMLTVPDGVVEGVIGIETQTIPPENVEASDITPTSAVISWTPILYTQDGGYYEVGYSLTSGGPYTIAGQTTDKTVDTATIAGLTPLTTYYVAVRTFTPAHANNLNTLTSDWSEEIILKSVATIISTPTYTPTATATTAITDLTATHTPTATQTGDISSQLQLLQPIGKVTDTIGNPMFVWTNVGASSYQLFVGTSEQGQFSGGMVFFRTNIAATACTGLTCSLRLTDLDPLAWLYNGEFIAFINTTDGSDDDWEGPYLFTIDAGAPAAPTIGEATNTSGSKPTIHWTLPNAAANAAFFHLYIAPAADLFNAPAALDVWVARNEACGGWDSTTCFWTPNVSLQPGRAYHVYVQSWGAGGFSTGGSFGNGWAQGIFNVGGPTPALPDAATYQYAPNAGQVTITFSDDANTTSVYFFIGNVGADPIVTNFLSEVTDAGLGCNGTTCSFTPELDVTLTTGTYTVYVQPKSAGGPRGDGILNLGWFSAGTFIVP